MIIQNIGDLLPKSFDAKIRYLTSFHLARYLTCSWFQHSVQTRLFKGKSPPSLISGFHSVEKLRNTILIFQK